MPAPSDREHFEAWAAQQAEPRVSDWLRESSAPDWEATVAHPLFDALADGSLPRDHLAHYLVQDYGFVDPFTALLGHAIGQAPEMADRVVLGRFMGMLTSEENTFFERAFEATGVPAEQRAAPPYLPVTRDFRRLLEDVGLGGDYAEILAVLVVTEWIYLGWAQRVQPGPQADSFAREWIGLHDNPEFERFVGWLRARLDAVAGDLPEPFFGQVAATFRATVRLERAFHDACWAG